MIKPHSALLMFLLAPAVWLAPISAQAGSDPENVIKALYRAHQPWDGKQLSFDNPKTLSKYFGKELTSLFLRNAEIEKACPTGELCGIDFDPFINAQDFEDHLHFVLRIEHESPSSANLYAAHFKLFNDDKSDQVVVFKLAKFKADWRITDIIYPDQVNASLKSILAAIH